MNTITLKLDELTEARLNVYRLDLSESAASAFG